MPDIAHTSEREERFFFGDEALFSSWSVLYKRKDITIDSILDLNNKRVAVLKDSIQFSSFKEDVKLFDIKPIFKEYENFKRAFEEVKNNNVDCVLANRFYGNKYYKMYDLEKTSILIKPSMLKFAFSKNNSELKVVVDHYLKEYKSDKNSIYYKSLQNLTDQESLNETPQWLITALFTLILLLIVAFIVVIIFKKMVNKTSSELNYLSKHDKLTGLPNRAIFIDLLEQNLKSAKRKQTNVIVIYFDIDNFHELNNVMGHDIGDKTLQYFANTLKNEFKDYDTIARFSSDEFIVTVENVALESMLLRVIENLSQLFKQPIIIDDKNIHLTFSAGIAMFPQDADSANELIKKSNIALHTAKSLGRNNFQFYKENMTEETYEKLSLVSKLKESIESEKLELYFQPKISVLTGEIIGSEALMRWTDTERGAISPIIFIPLAEDHGMINQLRIFCPARVD
jgi:diguanylate cyclase (GGDEF)-like protein